MLTIFPVVSLEDTNLRDYTSAIDRLVREIDRLGKNERRSTETRIKDYVGRVRLNQANPDLNMPLSFGSVD